MVQTTTVPVANSGSSPRKPVTERISDSPSANFSSQRWSNSTVVSNSAASASSRVIGNDP